MDIKEEKDEEEISSQLNNSSINFQSSVVASGSQLKAVRGNILTTGVPLVSQEATVSSSRAVLVNPSNTSKVLSGQTLVPISQSVNFNSSSLSLSNINAISARATLVPTTQSSNIISQPIQMYQSTSFDNCENVLDSQPNSTQAFLLAAPNTVLSSNQMVSQGQVFIQGDELVGVSIPASVASSYSVAETQYATAVPVIQGGGHTNSATGTSTRLIIQPTQSCSGNISSPIISTNNGHYLIQIGSTIPTVASNSNFSISNKGHIVIKSGVSKIKTEEAESLSSPPKDGVFRVIIPEGTTKLPRLSYPIKVNNNGEEAIRKHVQINLSNRATYQPPRLPSYDTASVQTTRTLPVEKAAGHTGRKLYECTNCSSKFMKALYLRMHMRSCKKPEVKPEKTPLYMCSFCKATFKTKPLIDAHFTKCSQCPASMKNTAEKRMNEEYEEHLPTNKKAKLADIDPVLEQAIQYKCQDCDRTFNKERQYTSHIKRCTKISVHDLSGMKAEQAAETSQDDDHDLPDDPFADPPPIHHTPPSRRGRGGSGRRGRPPGRSLTAAQKAAQRSNVLFEGEKLQTKCSALIVADNENLVRSTTGLAHTVQLTLETAQHEGQPKPTALVSDSKGVRGREKPPQAWSLVCSLCQKMYLTKVALANHVIECHGPELRSMQNILLGQSGETESLYRCPICNLHYQLSHYFLEHLVMQHTNQLQECFKNLQTQSASFVCSLCSLVLLTKNLLMEHLSLEHLDELEKIRLSASLKANKGVKVPLIEKNESCTYVSSEYTENRSDALKLEHVPIDLKTDDENPLECRYCGEELESQEYLKSHYIDIHGVETDADGSLLDLGFDVDIRVKDTKTLIQLADGKIDDSELPPKTVLIRKKPKQAWQCQSCHHVFTRQAAWLKHVRDVCPNNVSSDSSKSSSSQREFRFYCMEPECSHLAFLQFKSLTKHKEEAHNVVVKRERKMFKNLSLFYQWLSEEEKKHNVRFIRDSTRVEKNDKNNVRLIQMVCHRFHTAKAEQNKEKEQSDLSKPTKKRWYVRIQRENNCYARIYLRVAYHDSTKEFDGETQMIYYPEHFHNGIEDTPEVLERIREKDPKRKLFNAKSNGILDCDSSSSHGIDSPGEVFIEDGETSSIAPDTMNVDTHSHLMKYSSMTSGTSVYSASENRSSINNMDILSTGTSLSAESAIILPHATLKRTQVTSNGLLVENSDEAQFVLPSDVGGTDRKTLLMDGGTTSNFMVMNVGEGNDETPQDMNEEYILPADEAEWTKLFDALSTRVTAGELTGDDRKEADALLSYRNLISVTSLSQQVDIFQRMCSLTNIESS